MAYVHRIRHPLWSRNREEVVDRRPADTTVSPVAAGQNILSQIIWFIAGVISLILAIRFILAALAANSGNGFVHFIYTISHPFAAPFFGMFHYNDVYAGGSGSHIEIYTLVAIAIYLIAAWILTALINIGRRY